MESNIRVGDWFQIQYGFDERVFYVLSVTERGVWASRPDWLVSSAIFFPSDRMRDAQVIESGKRRWWWKVLPWRDIVCPFSKPSGMHFF